MNRVEWIDGLPFYTPAKNTDEWMTVDELIKNLNYINIQYGINYPEDDYIKLACNLLKLMPQQVEIRKLLKQVEKK